MNEITPAQLDRVMGGDLSVVGALARAPHEKLTAAWQRSANHVLSAEAVRHVLRQLLEADGDAIAGQQWASFVRRGYLEVSGPPIEPLDIEYDVQNEDQIVEAVNYLDQIGDLIDGDVDPMRLRELLASLGGVTR